MKHLKSQPCFKIFKREIDKERVWPSLMNENVEELFQRKLFTKTSELCNLASQALKKPNFGNHHKWAIGSKEPGLTSTQSKKLRFFQHGGEKKKRKKKEKKKNGFFLFIFFCYYFQFSSLTKVSPSSC